MMNFKAAFFAASILISGLACANDDAPATVGLKLSSGPQLFFDVAGKVSDKQRDSNTFIGIKGETPLTAQGRALQRFKEHLSQRSSVQVYGQVELGYQHRSD